MAMHEDFVVLRNSFIGALIAIFLNLLITASLGAIGSAIVWVISEISIMVLAIVYIRKKHHFSPPYRKLLQYAVSYMPLLGVAFLYQYFYNNEIVFLGVLFITTILYVAINEIFIMKNSILLNVVGRFKSFQNK